MGWIFGRNDTPESITREFVNGWEGMKCITYRIVPEDDYKVLWAVMEFTADHGEHKAGDRWIACVLIAPGHGGWGSKEMSESMGPCYYGCPVEFLNMAPPDGPYSEAWREKILRRAA